MSDIILCPACGCNQQRYLEKIDLKAQHQKYTPNSLSLASRLTEEARKSAPFYQMRGCNDCGLEFASPMRSPNAEWYDLAYQALQLYPHSRWEFLTCLNAFKPEDSVFEFGCGSGAFLELCGRQKIAAVGADFLPPAIEECRKKGLSSFVFNMGASLPESVHRSANQIVAFHILEHLAEPHLLFTQAAYVAKPEAKLWIAIPSCQRPTRQRGLEDFLDQPPHHMTRWNQKSLEAIGRNNGWRIVQLQMEPLPLRTALWWISTLSLRYQKLRSTGKISNASIERVIRYTSYPFALVRRLTKDRKLSGFSMLACYVRA